MLPETDSRASWFRTVGLPPRHLQYYKRQYLIVSGHACGVKGGLRQVRVAANLPKPMRSRWAVWNEWLPLLRAGMLLLSIRK